MDKEALKLEAPIKFWYQYQPTKENFNESLLPVGIAASVPAFWNLYQHFKRPSHLEDNVYLYAFKEQVKPVWEDVHNQNGGSFLLRFEKADSDKVWEDILLAFVVLGLKGQERVNGLRHKIRKNVLTIEVWISDASDAEQVEWVRDWIIRSICLNPDTSFELLKFQTE